MKIYKWTIASFLISLVLFWPSSLGAGEAMRLLSNVMLIVSILILVCNKYTPSIFVVLFGAYNLYCILVSFYNGTTMADHHLIISNVKQCLSIALIDLGCRKKPDKVIRTMFLVLLTFVLIDAVSVIMVPEGLFQAETVWNEWSTSYNPEWIYGNKNNRILYYLLLLLLAIMRRNQLVVNRTELSFAVLSAISVLTMILVKSSTSTAVVLGFVFIVYYYLQGTRDNVLKINPYAVFGVYTILEVLIVTGQAVFLNPIVNGLFNKDVTFTSRATAWSAAILHGLKNPIFGSGKLGEVESTDILGSLAYVNTHNMLLEVFIIGGIILLAILISVFALILYKSKRIENQYEGRIQNFVTFCVLILLIEGTFEVIVYNTVFWLILYFLYYITATHARNEVI